MFVTIACLLACLLTQVPSTLGQPAARPAPSSRAARPSAASVGAARYDRARLGEIEKVIEAAIARKELPGAVVAVGTEAGRRLAGVDRAARHPAHSGADDGRHDLRRRLAHQGGRDDDGDHDAGRAGQAEADRPRRPARARLREVRQARHHHPAPAHAYVRPAARPRVQSRVERLRHGDQQGGRRSARGAS